MVAVTGTDTGVGKTVATAALVALASANLSVAVYKPVQTGSVDGDSDITEVARLTGSRSVHEGAQLPEPLAPVTAARRAGRALPELADHVETINALAARHDLVVVEGAGGVLVALTESGDGIAELAAAVNASVVVVARAGLGTLNHTALTIEALRARDCRVSGVVIGSWPAEPDLAMQCNREELPIVTGADLLGVIPEGAAALPPAEFVGQASGWIVSNGWLS